MKWKCNCHPDDTWTRDFTKYMRIGIIRDQENKIVTYKAIKATYGSLDSVSQFHGKLTQVENDD